MICLYLSRSPDERLAIRGQRRYREMELSDYYWLLADRC
jgi:hypothetical protein